ncbi:MAG: carbohydrate binding family 9 domain-containing protein, partial [Bacteroidales bacterium]|nr:carbohydrate binding family 9 domain-containing protein [Bacteroidales bacterium]
MKKPLLLFILLQLVSYSYVICNTALSEPKKIYVTKKIEGNPPEIDGLVNEAVWDNIEWSNGFKQTAPFENIEPSQKTSFKILYDENNLFIAIKAFDAYPDSIEKRLTRRDEESGDKVGIGLDTYHDLRTAFIFIVNASGVKSDAIVTEDGGNWDYSWDPIWFVKTSINAEGWVAEIKIPLSQLRFGKQDVYLWGLNIGRTLFRKSEESLWQFISPKAAGWVSLFGELQGIKGIKPHKQKDIVPYIVSNFEKYEKEDGNPFAPGKEWHLNGGLDGKFGVTNDFTLDFTINPDFGQVEADPSEVNLSTFETRFEEKRPFFIEGRNILNFGLTPGDSPLSGDNIFYSRRIGRQPQYSPEYDDSYEFMDIPSYTTILGAFKLTGKTKDGWSVGVLESVTQNEKAVIKDTISGTTRHEN